MSLISKYNGKINITGDFIRKYRLEKGFSYEKLSAKLDLIGISIHKQSLYDIEHNKRAVKDYELFGLINILEIKPNDLSEEINRLSKN